MFTEIDKVLYPNKCEIIQTASHEFIYPIFKNGSSSLFQTAKLNNWKILLNTQIKNCHKIIVFVREPVERFQTGINTVIEHVLRENLDEKTIIYLIKNNLLINKHFLSQFLWLISLGRYTNPEVILSFKHIESIKDYTDLNKNESLKQNYNFKNDIDVISMMGFYIEADNFLMKYINTDISFKDLLLNYKKECKLGYRYIFEHSENLINVLPKN